VAGCPNYGRANVGHPDLPKLSVSHQRELTADRAHVFITIARRSM